MAIWRGLFERYRDRADLVTIYIPEAHPLGWWVLPTAVPIHKHKTLTDRLKAAEGFRARVGWTGPYFVDEISGSSTRAFDAWPEKLCIVENGRVVFLSAEAPFYFDLNDGAKWLQARFADRAQ